MYVGRLIEFTVSASKRFSGCITCSLFERDFKFNPIIFIKIDCENFPLFCFKRVWMAYRTFNIWVRRAPFSIESSIMYLIFPSNLCASPFHFVNQIFVLLLWGSTSTFTVYQHCIRNFAVFAVERNKVSLVVKNENEKETTEATM